MQDYCNQFLGIYSYYSVLCYDMKDLSKHTKLFGGWGVLTLCRYPSFGARPVIIYHYDIPDFDCVDNACEV